MEQSSKKKWYNHWSIKLVTLSIYVLLCSQLGSLINDSFKQCKRDKLRVSEVEKAELKYFETKSKLVDEVQQYISNAAPTSNLEGLYLVETCSEYHMDIKFVLAQGEIESMFGTIGLGSKTNSVWNVGAYDGLSYSEILKRYKYSHPNQSLKPYLDLLERRYLTDDKLEIDLMKDYTDINGNRFASDPGYESKLQGKYEKITKVTKIDSLQSVLKHYAIKCNRF